LGDASTHRLERHLGITAKASLPQDGFRALFDAQVGFVLRALRRHGVRERDLQDACQETFLVVHRRLTEFEHRSSLRTWIYGITLRVAVAHRRKAYVVRERLDGQPATPDAHASNAGGSQPVLPLESAEQRQMLLLVESALAATSDERREVFVLYELENMTMREVSEALAIPENTAFSRLYGARDDVRAFIERRERAVKRTAGGQR
jgi:RNA polymerase sigma-70 factor (ECF subfamily)